MCQLHRIARIIAIELFISESALPCLNLTIGADEKNDFPQLCPYNFLRTAFKVSIEINYVIKQIWFKNL